MTMRRIWITAGIRVEKVGDRPEDKSEVIILDWDTKEIIGSFTADSGKEITVGRSRGASGIAWHEGFVYVATRKGLQIINPDTYEEDHTVDMSGRPMAFHGMKSDGYYLKVTCHGVDIVQGIRNKKAQIMYATNEEDGFDFTMHGVNGLNAIGFNPSGEEFHLYSHRLLIYNWTKKEIAVEGVNNSPHDLCFLSDNEVLVTRSSAKELMLCNVRTGEKNVVFTYPGGGYMGPNRATLQGWTRGIAYNKSTESVFVMSSPGTLIELDRNTWEVKDSFEFCNRSEASPFDLVLDPRDWNNNESE